MHAACDMASSTSKRTKARAHQAPWEHEAPAKTARKKPKTLSPAQKAHAKQRARKAGRPYPNLVDNMHEAASAQPAKRAPRKKATTRRGSSAKSNRQAGTRAPAKAKARGAAPKTSTARKSPTADTSARKTSARKTSARKTSTADTSARKTSARKTPGRKTSTANTSARRTSARKTPARKTSSSRSTRAKPAARSASTKRAANRASGSMREKDPRGGLTAAGRAAFARRDGSHLRPGVKKAIAEVTPDEMRRKGSWAVRFYGRAGKLPPLTDGDGQPTRFALSAAAWGEPVPKTERAARAIADKGQRLLARARAKKGR